MSDESVNLFSLLGDEIVTPESPKAKEPPPVKKRRAKKAEKEAPLILESPVRETVRERAESEAQPTARSFADALPILDDLAEILARAAGILSDISEKAKDALPDSIDFPPEDDPFARTAEEWETHWYSLRESALRVYANLRVEFRKHLLKASRNEPNDLIPWTYWAFRSRRPAEGEPAYGLTAERREELRWNYPGSPDDFMIYRDEATPIEE